MKASGMIRIDHIFKRCWTIYTNQYKKFIIIPVIMMLVFSLAGYVTGYFLTNSVQDAETAQTIVGNLLNPREAGVYVMIIAFLIAAIVQIIGIITLIITTLKNSSKVSGGDIFREAFDHFWKFVGITIMLAIIDIVAIIIAYIPTILIGIIIYFIFPSNFFVIFTFLSIIPTIVALVYVFWYVFSFFPMAEGKGILASLKESKEVIKGKWIHVFWRVLVMYIIIAVFGYVLSLIPYIGIPIAFIIFIPLNLIYIYVMYEDLKIQKK